MTERKMKDSGIPWIGMIPEDWEVCRVKNISVKISSGEALPKEKITDSGYPVLGGGSQIGFYNEYNTNNSLIIGRVGSCGSVTIVEEPTWATDNALILYTNQHLRWSYYLLTAANLKDLNTSNAQPLITAGKVREFNICLPPVEEQERIAGWLDEKCGDIDELIEVERKMIETLEAYRQATITEAVTGSTGILPVYDENGNRTRWKRVLHDMRQTGISWLPQIPSNWKTDKILRLFDKFGSGTTPKGEEWFAEDEGIPWINSGDLNFGFLTSVKKAVKPNALKEISALKIYPINSIIIAMYGASIGKISISKIEGCTNQACFVMSKERADVCLKYIFYQLYSFKDRWVELSFGGTQPNINADNIKQTWLALPPLDEQRAIAEYLDAKCKEIDELIAVKREKIETLKQYRQSLIFEAVTGKIQIN